MAPIARISVNVLDMDLPEPAGGLLFVDVSTISDPVHQSFPFVAPAMSRAPASYCRKYDTAKASCQRVRGCLPPGKVYRTLRRHVAVGSWRSDSFGWSEGKVIGFFGFAVAP